MAKFQFSLEPVLRQRAAREDAAEQALALAHNEHRRSRASLDNARRRLEAVCLSAEKIDVDLFEEIHLSLYRAQLAGEIVNREEDVKRAGQVVDERRDDAVRARRERQVVEKLREKKLQIFLQEASSREEKVADELSIYAHLRRIRQL